MRDLNRPQLSTLNNTIETILFPCYLVCILIRTYSLTELLYGCSRGDSNVELALKALLMSSVHSSHFSEALLMEGK